MSRATSRRSLAALPAAALLASAGPVLAATPGADAVLLARVEDLVAFLIEERAFLASLSDDDRAEANAYLRSLARRGIATEADRRSAAVAKLPATTLEGLRAKARAAVWQAGGDDTAMPRILIAFDLIGSMLADLTGLPRTMKGTRA